MHFIKKIYFVAFALFGFDRCVQLGQDKIYYDKKCIFTQSTSDTYVCTSMNNIFTYTNIIELVVYIM